MNTQISPQNYVAAPAGLRTDLETLISKNLPPAPGNINRITKLLRNENSTIKQITEAICYEPVLVARLLRLANSPIYSLERSVTSVQMAISAIGIKTLQDIVMLEFAAATFGKYAKSSHVAKQIWEHSLSVALLSREFSKMLGMRGFEEAFSCGLLHDIGKLILLSSDAEEYSELLNELDENKMLLAETRRYGYTHALVGSAAIRQWGLPDEISFAIQHHHNPSQAEYQPLIAHLVDLADIVSMMKGFGLRAVSESALMYSESAIKLRLTEEQIEEAWEKIKDHIQEVVETFS